ncbi:MAG: TRAP transporter substrate-binding protein [Alphaproteobacteria bacterium]|nr:TRAP transporter substrate-binding protein [Alphaproteobacteria bacterium]
MQRLFALGAATLLAFAVGMNQASADKVRWKLGSSYPSNLDVIGENITRYVENVKTMTNGDVELRFFEPGALVPALQVFDAVSTGAIDASYTTPGFHAGKFPAGTFFASVPFGPGVNEYVAWMRFGGGNELYRELYHGYGVQPFTCGIVVAESSGWFRKEIKSLDELKGLKMRFFGLGAKVMEKFGVSTQLLASGDIYPALELGTIDATEFSYPTLDRKLGFYQVAKHQYFPGWHQQASFVETIFNKAKFDALSKGQRMILEVACSDAMLWVMAKAEANQGEAIEFHKSKGVTIHKWTDAQLKELEKAWNQVAVEEAAKDPMFKKFWDSYDGFRKKYAAWKELAYLK